MAPGGLAQILLHEILGGATIFVEVNAARGRCVFLGPRIDAGHRLAAVKAARAILARTLGADFGFGLFGVVGKAEALAVDLDRIGAAAGQPVTGGLAHQGGSFRHLAVEIDVGGIGQLLAQLIAQHLGLDGFNRAHRNIAQLERAEADTDQAVHFQPERAQHVLDFAVLAFAQRHDDPHIGALLALERGFDRAILDAIDLDAILEAIQRSLGDGAVGAHAIAAQPAGRGQLKHALEAAIIGQQQQAFGVDIETTNGDHARQTVGFEVLENGLATFGILLGNHQARGLVVEPDAGALAGSQRRAIDQDLVTIGDVEGGGHHLLAVDHDAAGGDPDLGIAARAQARTGDDLGEAVTDVGFGRSFVHGADFLSMRDPVGRRGKRRRPAKSAGRNRRRRAARATGYSCTDPRRSGRYRGWCWFPGPTIAAPCARHRGTWDR